MRYNMNIKKKILIVDDDTALAVMCTELLNSLGYIADAVDCGTDAITKVQNDNYAIIITDMVMPNIDGIELLKKIKLLNDKIDVVVMTSYATVNNAVEAMKLGAADYITKPFKRDELELKYKFENIIGESYKMKDVYSLINSVCDTEANILIQGETGTGKELVARAIHYNSMRKNKPFVKVDCAALTETLLESELFGHVRGSFTGATKDRAGRFRMADKGTIFLDEVSNIPLTVQAKLLRALQDCEFEPVGSDKTSKVDVRIIAATNTDLEIRVQKDVFRKDLFYRLKVITITLPPLRERLDDISLLVAHFLKKYCKKNKRHIKGLTRSAVHKLMSFNWPGNVRELENLIERAVVLCKTKTIETEDLQLPTERHFYATDTDGKSFHEMIDFAESQIISDTLNRVNWDKEKAAKLLKISRASLYNKIKKYNFSPMPDTK